MSYILKALKKSQQDRDRGSVPKLTRAPEPAPGRERRLWPWWLAGALAVNVVAVAGGLWWFDSGSDPGKTTSGEAVICEDADTLVLAMGHEPRRDLAEALAGWPGELHQIGDCLAPRTAEEAVLEGLKVGAAL